MKNSILSSILKLRKQFTDESTDNFSIITNLVDEINTNDFDASWLSDYGVSYALHNDFYNQVTTFTVTDDNGSETHQFSQSERSAFRFGQYEGLQDITVKGVSLGEALTVLSDGAKRKESFAKVCDLFVTKSRARATDVFAVCDSVDFAGLDMSSLKTMIASAQDENGYVSQYSWLMILKSIYDENDAAISKGKAESTLQLDQSNVFYVSNVLASVIPQILTVIGTILLTVGNVVLKVIGFIVMAVGAVISYILTKTFDGALHTKPYCSDSSSSTDYVAGPYYSSVSKCGMKQFAGHEQQAVMRSCGPMDYYFFPGVDGYMNVNSFLSLEMDFDSCMSVLAPDSLVHFTYEPGTDGSTVVIDNILDPATTDRPTHYYSLPDACYLSQEDLIAQRGASDDRITEAIFENIIVLGLMMRDIRYSHKWQDSFDWNSNFPLSTMSDSQKAWAASVFPFALAMDYLVHVQFKHPSLTSYVNWHLSQFGTNYILNFLMYGRYGFETSCPEGSSTPVWTGLQERCVFQTIINGAGGGLYNNYYSQTPLMLKYDTESNKYQLADNAVDLTDENYFDFIPEDRCYTMNNTSLDELIKAGIISAVVITGVVVIGSIVKAKIRKLKFKYRLKSVRGLNSAAEQYYSNPTDANFETFYKAQKSYNLKAKFLGWPQYDAVNKWYNYGETPVNNSDSLSDLRKLITGR